MGPLFLLKGFSVPLIFLIPVRLRYLFLLECAFIELFFKVSVLFNYESYNLRAWGFS